MDMAWDRAQLTLVIMGPKSPVSLGTKSLTASLEIVFDQ